MLLSVCSLSNKPEVHSLKHVVVWYKRINQYGIIQYIVIMKGLLKIKHLINLNVPFLQNKSFHGGFRVENCALIIICHGFASYARISIPPYDKSQPRHIKFNFLNNTRRAKVCKFLTHFHKCVPTRYFTKTARKCL